MQEGQRFSLVYLERGAPVRDNRRFRNRLAACFHDLSGGYRSSITEKVCDLIHKETGIEVPYSVVGHDVKKFFKNSEIRDVLDTITLIHQVLTSGGYAFQAETWKDFVARVLREENLGYQLDSKCGVHYFVDEEFERNRVSTILALENPKYASVQDAYESAYHYMDSHPADTKAAVRSMFEALEILVRQMVPTTKNLNRWVVENPLKQQCLKPYANEPTAGTVVSGLFDGFGDWVDKLHNYRHGQPSQEPVAPTEEVAVYVLSSGSAFLRWLLGINNSLSNANG